MMQQLDKKKQKISLLQIDGQSFFFEKKIIYEQDVDVL